VPPYTLQESKQAHPALGREPHDIAKKMIEKKQRLADAKANFVKSMDKLNEELVLLKTV